MPVLKNRLLLPIVVIALGLALGSQTSKAQEPEVAGGLVNETEDAVQTYYENGVPHTDWNGNTITTYSAGSSFFPRGMYYPELCRRSHTFTWPRFTGNPDFDGNGVSDWDGTYRLWVDLVDNIPPSSDPLNPGERVRPVDLGNIGPFAPSVTPSATSNLLPANENLHWRVLPEPWFAYWYWHGGASWYDDTVSKTCPSSDDDDPNAVQTLKNNGFNLAIIQSTNHPQPFINLKNDQSITNFKFVVDTWLQCCVDFFPDQLFNVSGGQGYSAHPDIYGWLTDDEPVTRSGTDSNPVDGICDAGPITAALNRTQSKYTAHQSQTNQVVFHTEGAPDYFQSVHSCQDPGGKWAQSVQIGDAANHDYYVGNIYSPATNLTSVEPIAETVADQTQLNGEAKPSWFTTQAFATGNGNFRTPAQTRAMVFAAIVHGATGIWYFGWDSFVIHPGIRPDPEIPASYPEQAPGGVVADTATRDAGEAVWAEVSLMNNQLGGIDNVLLWPTSFEGYDVFVSHGGQNSPSPVHTMLKSRPNNEHYLIAVNMDNTSVNAEFRFNHSITTKFKAFGGLISGSGNTISETFSPFETQVYYIKFNTSTFIDTDSNGGSDGVANFIDNCPNDYNPNQTDSDQDDIGDACDSGTAVGGIARLPEVSERRAAAPSPRSTNVAGQIIFAIATGVGVVMLAGGGCYALRRRGRREL